MSQRIRKPVARWLLLGVSISAAALLAGCGGGGGGGGDTSTSATTTSPAAATTTTSPAPSLVTLVTAPVSSFLTTEYKRQAGLAMINAATAWATGASGQGVVVAINDGVIDTSISELSGRLSGTTYNWTGDSTISIHATHIAGIIAADHDGTGIEGVAWSATLMSLVSFTTDGSTNTGYGNAPYSAISYAADHGADIVNNSWGSSPTASMPGALVTAVRHATDLGTIVVFSTGNDGGDQPNTTALVPQYDSATTARFLAVTAVDQNGSIASYANACGAAASWCLAAPGTAILSTGPDGTYVSMSGTSMAAPMVSGALAVVMSRFPELTSAQVVSRVLTTADKTGIYANTAFYGQGLLDLGAATQPIGTLTANAVGSTVTPTGTTTATSSGAALVSNAVMGDALRHALANVPVALFDSYDGATFTTTMDSLVVGGGTPDYAGQAFGDFGRGHFTTRGTAGGVSLALGERQIEVGAGAALTASTLSEDAVVAAVRLQLGEATTAFAGVNASLAEVAPAYDALPTEAGLALTAGAFTPGALSLADDGAVLGIDTNLGRGASLTLAVMNGSGGQAVDFLTRDGGAAATGALASFRQSIGHGITLEAGVGYLAEDGSLLGASGQGLLDFGRSETAQVSIGATVALSDKTALYARYDRAFTMASGNGAFLAGSQDVTSDSWTVGILGADAVVAGDHWGFSSHQPLRAGGGTMVLARPAGRTTDGTVYGDTVTVDLSGGGREIDWEAFYALPMGEQGLLGFNLLYVTDPGNQAQVADEVLAMLRYRLRFN